MTRQPQGRVRVIASNLHVGGGVQVAASLLNEWAADDVRSTLPANLLCEVSPAVFENLSPAARQGLPVVVKRRRPLSVHYWLDDVLHRDEATLVVFGPTYFPVRSKRKVFGYADVTSLYHPREYGVSGELTPTQRARRWWSRRWIAGADVAVVETTALRDRLCEALGSRAPREVIVVPNAVNSYVLSGTDTWPLEREPDEVVLAYPTRAYPHKNLEFLPRLAEALAAQSGQRLRFAVTLTDDEWAQRSQDFRASCVNVGPLMVSQVGALMRAADGVIFPSLLEAFSATPIEAMALGVPLFASERDFVRAVCSDGATYIEPLDASATARVVLEAIESGSAKQRADVGRERAAALPRARERAVRYVALLGEPNA